MTAGSRLTGLLTWERRDADPEVLFVTNMYPDPERPVYGIFVKRQIESLSRAGLRADVLYVRGYKGPHAYLAAIAYFFVMSFRKRRYKLVHAHAGETAFVARFWIGVPMVASYCGDDVLGHAHADGTISPLHRLRRRILKEQSRLLDRTITKSAEMEAVLPVRSRNSVVPNGVDTATFKPRPIGQARSELGWSADERVVLFAATRPYEERKRLPLAQASVAIAEDKLGPVRLFIAENVEPATVPKLMNAADCLLLTSQAEGSPNAVKEAIMSDLPVVSTDVGDVAQLVSGVARSTVCGSDAQELGSALIDALEPRGRSDGSVVRRDLADTVIADRVLDVYEAAGASVGPRAQAEA